ncbi:hypothetical protein KGM_204607 [Danaus plexippus plexippus]|uniref:Uncharacterized protein n=1 Tax=Danaus plexippus plexippus TaxID=278856 RepID=A0A212FD74_DANPL|nr:hypothetical protein KGM_204607 [Danaus plexippus plexippus]
MLRRMYRVEVQEYAALAAPAPACPARRDAARANSV